jgi:hypothetical protein
MQIIAKYRHQFLNELKSYTIHLVDNICTCTEDGTEDAVVLNWNGESVSGNLSDEVLNGVSALITKTIQDVSAAGLLLV